MPEANALLYMMAALANLAGMAWLALAMDVHWQQAHGSETPPAKSRRWLRLLGCGGLLAGAWLCGLADRPSMAVLVWLMLLAASVPVVGMALAKRPRLLRLLWPGG